MRHLDSFGLVSAADHPREARHLQRAAASGALVRIYPGIYADPARVAEPIVRVRAAQLWAPAGVLLGAGAALLTFLPGGHVSEVELSAPALTRAPRGIRLVRHSVPDAHVRRAGGFALTDPAFTAVYLAAVDGGAAIDEVLRRGVNLADLHRAAAAMGRWVGNPARRAVLADSRDEPWSQAERLLHSTLRSARIVGWCTNVPVRLPCGLRLLDLGFIRQRVAIEVDGRAFHSDPRAFEADREKQDELVRAGWVVLRFTWAMLTERPEWVLSVIAQTLAARRREVA